MPSMHKQRRTPVLSRSHPLFICYTTDMSGVSKDECMCVLLLTVLPLKAGEHSVSQFRFSG